MDAVLIRALEAAGIILAGLFAYSGVNWLVLSRARRGSARLGAGKPAIVYFTTPDCVPCKTVQRPAIQRLQERLGDQLRVIEVDARQNPQMAREWGVLSVPTTFILDAAGKPVHVNHGVASADKLLAQLNTARR